MKLLVESRVKFLSPITFLELYSKTVLHHCPSQLKKVRDLLHKIKPQPKKIGKAIKCLHTARLA